MPRLRSRLLFDRNGDDLALAHLKVDVIAAVDALNNPTPASNPASNPPDQTCALAMRTIAARLRSTSSSVVAQQDTLMRMAAWPCHSVPPHQQVPSFWTAATTRLVVAASPNETST